MRLRPSRISRYAHTIGKDIVTGQGKQFGVGRSLAGGLEAKAVEIASAANSRAIRFRMGLISFWGLGNTSLRWSAYAGICRGTANGADVLGNQNRSVNLPEVAEEAVVWRTIATRTCLGSESKVCWKEVPQGTFGGTRWLRFPGCTGGFVTWLRYAIPIPGSTGTTG